MVAYGISINLVEVTWKSKIKAQFPNPNDYSAFMGDFSTATGVPCMGLCANNSAAQFAAFLRHLHTLLLPCACPMMQAL